MTDRLLKLGTFLLLTLFLPASRGQSPPAVDWKYEIDLLGRELADKHNNLFFSGDSVKFFHSLERVAEAAPGKPVFDVSVKLQQAVADLGDAHTQINYHFNIEPRTHKPSP